MAIIFYAVGGEGMGHATRSEAVIHHLLTKGHKIVILSYGRPLDYLKDIFKSNDGVLEIVKIVGINFVLQKNRFRLGKTILKESTKIPPLLIKNIYIFLNRISKYNPSLIITDFELISNHVAKLLKIPLICIDNVNFMVKCQIDKKFKKSISTRFVKYILNFNGDYNFILSVFNVPLREKYKNNTCLVGPIIRGCLSNSSNQKNFVLVYQSSKSNTKLIEVLKKSNEQYVIYGLNKEQTEKNLIFKKQSNTQFAKDLVSCKAIITNGGFTLISEAVALNKPIYSIPIRFLTEQEINGYYLDKLKFGICSKEINKSDLNCFLRNLEKYKLNLSKIKCNKNELFNLLDKQVDFLTNSYKGPSRFKMIIKIQAIYHLLVQRVTYTTGIMKKTRGLIFSPSYLATKAYLVTRLNYLRHKKSKDTDELIDVGVTEKTLVLNEKEKISYISYKSSFKSNTCSNLLFLHGLGGDKYVFINLMNKLLEFSKEKINFKIVMVDLAGHGKSTNFKSIEKYKFFYQSKFIKKIVDKEFGKNSKMDVIGHCFGSFVAIKLSTLLRERIKHLFLVSSDPFFPNSKKLNLKTLRLLFKKIRIPSTLAEQNTGVKKFLDYNIIRLLLDIKNTSFRGYFSSLYVLILNTSSEDFLELLHKKTKVIMVHGKKDRVFPYKGIKKNAKEKNVKLFTLAKSNHLPVFNAYDKLAKIILKELKK